MSRDILHEINIKIDHLTFIQCEIFAMLKQEQHISHKLDTCINILNKIHSKQNQNIQYSTIPISNIEKSIPIYKKKQTKSINKGPSIQDQLIKELKLKLKSRGGIHIP